MNDYNDDYTGLPKGRELEVVIMTLFMLASVAGVIAGIYQAFKAVVS